MSKLTPKDAYQLVHEGTLALADMEANGFRVDVERLKSTITKLEAKLKRSEERLKKDEVWKEWVKVYGSKANIDSRVQLGGVLFNRMGFQSSERTEKTGRPKVSENTLRAVGIPFTKKWLDIQHYSKFLSTSLKGILNELVGDRVHAMYDLHLAISHRSRCEKPNMQNQPIREPITGEMIRKCFIPSPGHRLLEVDYGSHEFKICSCFYRDKNMMEYASDPTKDIHRDMAKECYVLPEGKVPKQARFYTKNQFVFPQIYGSDYVACSRNLWNAIESFKLKTEDGVPLKRHLRKVASIRRLGFCDRKREPIPETYEYHVRRVQASFNKRFSQYSKRKEIWWERYQKEGGFRLMTGFDIKGIYRRFQVYNIPIQGPAFHCLLWCLIRINNWLKKKKMKTLPVATIHDSILFDCHKDEMQDVMTKCKEVMMDEIRQAWDWIVVPLLVEFEASPVDGTWWDKKEFPLV